MELELKKILKIQCANTIIFTYIIIFVHLYRIGTNIVGILSLSSNFKGLLAKVVYAEVFDPAKQIIS